MKILLINSNRYYAYPTIPVGLCIIADAVENDGHDVCILDLFFSSNCKQALQDKINLYKPDIVGIGIRNIDNAAGYKTEFFLESIKNDIIIPCKKFFSGPVVIGGAAVGISGAEMLSFFGLEYAIQGEGENSFVEFIRKYKHHEVLDSIKGLIIHKNGRIVVNNPPEYIVNSKPDFLGHHVFRFIDFNKYYKRYNARLQIQTKRGCALHCVYCTYNRIEGKRFRLYEPQSIADHIEFLVHQTSIRAFEFTDNVFNIPLTHCKEVLKAIIQKKMDIDLTTMGLHPAAIDQELIDLMKQSGFKETDLGVEAACDISLKNLGKNFTKAHVLNAGELLYKNNIHINWCLLLGAPNETESTIRETIETITHAANKWDLISTGIGIRIYQGAPISDKNTSRQSLLLPVNYVPENISLEQIYDIVEEYASNHFNILIYNDYEKKHNPLSRAVSNLVYAYSQEKIFSPDLPSWQWFILYKRFMKAIDHYL
ncbi:Radical SAM domain-containing protein [Candidatus Magnetomorum sp. HK-1]|nr:Radical SAM domain-containing protein [Candidatus Magnetomorum sp. HK-1]